MSLERRSFRSEIRVARGGKLRGHAAVFESLSSDLGGFKEKIARGAFAKSIEKADVRALWNHDANYVLGRNKSGTLRLAEDQKGLAIEIDPPDTQTIRDLVLAPIERGDVSQMSFGFRTVSDKWETQDKVQVRTLLEVELFDVSPVTFPAYPKTDIALNSLRAWQARRPLSSAVTRPSTAAGMLRRISSALGRHQQETQTARWMKPAPDPLRPFELFQRIVEIGILLETEPTELRRDPATGGICPPFTRGIPNSRRTDLMREQLNLESELTDLYTRFCCI